MNHFLAATVNNRTDSDEYRQVAYKVIDGMGLRVTQPVDEDHITLENPKTKKTITFNREEFGQAIAFIIDRSADTTGVRSDSKTAKLLMLFSRPGKWRGWYDYTDTRLPSDVKEEKVKGELHTKLDLQNRVNWVRTQLDVVLDAPPTRSLLNKLTMGLVGSDGTDPATGDPLPQEGKPTVEQVCAGIRPEDLADVMAVVRDMQEKGLIDWDENGHYIDVANNATMNGSNIFNLVSFAFNPDQRVSDGREMGYVPTGQDVFMNQVMRYNQAMGHIPPSVIAAIKAHSRQGKLDWTRRRTKDGKTANLLSMWLRLKKLFGWAAASWRMLGFFLMAANMMGLVNFGWAYYVDRLLEALGYTKKQSDAAVAVQGPLYSFLNWLEPYMPEGFRTTTQALWRQYGEAASEGLVRRIGGGLYNLAAAGASLATGAARGAAGAAARVPGILGGRPIGIGGL
jgi:hypothetical protein